MIKLRRQAETETTTNEVNTLQNGLLFCSVCLWRFQSVISFLSVCWEKIGDGICPRQTNNKHQFEFWKCAAQVSCYVLNTELWITVTPKTKYKRKQVFYLLQSAWGRPPVSSTGLRHWRKRRPNPSQTAVTSRRPDPSHLSQGSSRWNSWVT